MYPVKKSLPTGFKNLNGQHLGLLESKKKDAISALFFFYKFGTVKHGASTNIGPGNSGDWRIFQVHVEPMYAHLNVTAPHAVMGTMLR